jgi:hypothetical protein
MENYTSSLLNLYRLGCKTQRGIEIISKTFTVNMGYFVWSQIDLNNATFSFVRFTAVIVIRTPKVTSVYVCLLTNPREVGVAVRIVIVVKNVSILCVKWTVTKRVVIFPGKRPMILWIQ